MNKRPWVLEVLVALDQLGNAIAGGCCNQTVSGRIGWHANYGDHKALWRPVEIVVDWGFSPVDGNGHCISSVELHLKTADHTTVGLIAVSTLAIGFAVPIGILLRARALFIWCRDAIRSNFK